LARAVFRKPYTEAPPAALFCPEKISFAGAEFGVRDLSSGGFHNSLSGQHLGRQSDSEENFRGLPD
jgi:hypothetical protein